MVAKMPDLYESIIKMNLDYQTLSRGSFADSGLLDYTRYVKCADLSNDAPEFNKQVHLCHASLGQGQWAGIPWVTIYDKTISTTAQHGYYIAFLFIPSKHKVYLTLNQGFTFFKKEYSSRAIEKIKAVADYWKENLKIPNGFNIDEIDLNKTGSSYAPGYAAGNICSKLYAADAFPNKEDFYHDINELLIVFKELKSKIAHNFIETNKRIIDLSQTQNTEDIETDDRTSHVVNTSAPEGKKLEIYTTKYERKPKNRRNCIIIQGTKCKACGFDFEQVYGRWGQDFVEVHHIKPLYSLEEEVNINPAVDLVPLCSNCHRMIHRRKNQILTVQELINLMRRE